MGTGFEYTALTSAFTIDATVRMAGTSNARAHVCASELPRRFVRVMRYLLRYGLAKIANNAHEHAAEAVSPIFAQTVASYDFETSVCSMPHIRLVPIGATLTPIAQPAALRRGMGGTRAERRAYQAMDRGISSPGERPGLRIE